MVYNPRMISLATQQIMSMIESNPDQFSSLSRIKQDFAYDEENRLRNDLDYSGFETFGENETGTAFQSEEQAEQYIEQRVNEQTLSDIATSMGTEEIINYLDSNGLLQDFVKEINQYIVFSSMV